MVNIASETKEDRVLMVNPDEAWFIVLAAHTFIKFPEAMSLLFTAVDAPTIPTEYEVNSLFAKVDKLVGEFFEDIDEKDIIRAD